MQILKNTSIRTARIAAGDTKILEISGKESHEAFAAIVTINNNQKI